MRNDPKRTPLRLCLAAVLAALALMLAACTPAYDSIADQLLADTQKQADQELLRLENLAMIIDRLTQSSAADDCQALANAKTQASYASNMDFYDNLQSSLLVLDARMTAMPDLSTPKLTDALSQLEKNAGEVRTSHATQNFLSADYLKASRQVLDQQFRALTVYELTIRGGGQPQ
ncbi:MAG TPA: hypothetical protein VGY99_04580 [Candidatus Binataceae bacterium]|jgi:hypothetical protein|nr:hypothetical protein [Candidatus Binataceae bacterium]